MFRSNTGDGTRTFQPAAIRSECHTTDTIHALYMRARLPQDFWVALWTHAQLGQPRSSSLFKEPNTTKLQTDAFDDYHGHSFSVGENGTTSLPVHRIYEHAFLPKVGLEQRATLRPNASAPAIAITPPSSCREPWATAAAAKARSSL